MSVSLRAAGYRYPSGVGIGPVDLEVAAGELVLLTGPTGCGKSTVLRLAAGLAQRHGHGQAEGEVRIAGRDPLHLRAIERVRTLGYVAQDPDDQTIADTVGEEIAFGLRCAGAAPAEVKEAVDRLAAAVGLGHRLEDAPRRLSGGQRQRLVVAAALAGGARVLLLDEPLAQLDPAGAAELLDLLRRLADDGVAVLLVEHRLELALPRADRTALMAGGRLVTDFVRSPIELHAHGLRGPALDEIGALIGPPPWRARLYPGWARPEPEPPPPQGSVTATLKGIVAGYDGPPVLDGLDLVLHDGERVALLGANGSGKSTLLAVLAGTLRPRRGARTVPGRAVHVPQNPDLSLFAATVRAELAYAPLELGASHISERVARAADRLSVAPLLDRPPQALSRGQRLRVAVAGAVTAAPTLLLLDEPTSGQDREQVDRMLDGLTRGVGGTLVFATHDVDAALRHATRTVVLDGGRIVWDGPIAALLAAHLPAALPLPPLAALAAHHALPYGSPEQIAASLERAP